MEASRGAHNPTPTKSKVILFLVSRELHPGLRVPASGSVSVGLPALPPLRSLAQLALPSEAWGRRRSGPGTVSSGLLDGSRVSVESRLLETWSVLFLNRYAGPGLASRWPCVSMGTRPQRPVGSRTLPLLTSLPKQRHLPPCQLRRRVPRHDRHACLSSFGLAEQLPPP